MIRNLLFFLLSACTFLFFYSCGGIVSSATAKTEQFHETYKTKPNTRLELHNRNGSVRIHRWNKAMVEVFAEKKAGWFGNLDEVKIEVTLGDKLIIETKNLVKNPKVSVEYTVQVPADVIVNRVDTSNGAIKLQGTKGDVVVRTSNGKIFMEDILGNVEAKTSNGKIEIKNVKGVVEAETSNGSINITGASGIVKAETSNGGIEAGISAIHAENTRIKPRLLFEIMTISP